MASRSIRYKSLSIRSPRFVGVGVGDDNDAAAFLQEAGITDYMQQRAIFELVSRLKGAGLWSKMKAIYPFIGGTASTHKWNLKDPRDVDAAFRLSFSGGWTHSSTGALPNGTNGYAETYFSPSTNWSDEKGSIGTYLRTNNTKQAVDIGSWVTSKGYTYIYTYFNLPPTGRDYRINASDNATGRILNITRTDGYFLASRTSTTLTKGYRNGVVEVTDTNADDVKTNITIGIGALKGFGTPAGLYSDRETAFATIGDGLTDSEASALYTIVDLYQKRLSRAV